MLRPLGNILSESQKLDRKNYIIRKAVVGGHLAHSGNKMLLSFSGVSWWQGILFTQQWRGSEWVYWSSLEYRYVVMTLSKGERLGNGPKVELPGLSPSAQQPRASSLSRFAVLGCHSLSFFLIGQKSFVKSKYLFRWNWYNPR